jgi:hypothetical protein
LTQGFLKVSAALFIQHIPPAGVMVAQIAYRTRSVSVIALHHFPHPHRAIRHHPSDFLGIPVLGIQPQNLPVAAFYSLSALPIPLLQLRYAQVLFDL